MQALQIKDFFRMEVWVFGMFVVPLQVEVAVLPARALNCVFYERAWLLLFLHSHAGNKLIFHVSHVLTRIFIVCVDPRDTR